MPSDKNVFLKVQIGTGTSADVSAQCVQVDVQDEDRGTDRAVVVMDNQAESSTDAIREGTEVRIEMGWESAYALMFVGRVHRVHSAARSGGVSRIQMLCHDVSTLLNQRPEEPNLQHVGTLTQILTAIAGEQNIEMGDVQIDPMPSWTEDDTLDQGTRTSWQMIQDLAEEYRARAFMEVNSVSTDTDAEREAGGIPRLYFLSEEWLLAQDSIGKLRYCTGFGEILEFDTQRIGSGASPSAQSTMIDPVSGEICTEDGDPHAPDPPVSLTEGQAGNLTSAMGSGRARNAEAAVQIANDQPVQPSDVRRQTRVAGAPSDCDLSRRLVERDQTRILGLHGRGLAMGTIFLRAKGTVEITGLSSTAEGIWYLKRVNHIVEQAQTRDRVRKTYRTRFEATR
jgi:phage protein D